MNKINRINGFSLVELAIVLVILGLLAGGVLSGQSLIRAAEMRSVTTQTDRYITSVYAFRDKYFAIPGDMPNAVKFWGAAAGNSNDNVNTGCDNSLRTASTDKTTCNGNGDGFIALNTAEDFEMYRMWQHLANAGLIEGAYSGVSDSAVVANTKTPKIGTNVPAGKLANTGFTVVSYPPNYNQTTYFPFPGGNVLYFGGVNTSYTSNPALKPEEAWNIDTKLDDGKPASGKIMSWRTATDCNTSTDPTLSEYKLQSSTIGCALMIILGV